VTEGATISKIAGDLGITDATLSAWIKAVGVTVRGPRERAEGQRTHAGHRTGNPAGGAEVLHRRDDLVSRFRFVADHQDTFQVKGPCQRVEVARTSLRPVIAVGGPMVEAATPHRH